MNSNTFKTNCIFLIFSLILLTGCTETVLDLRETEGYVSSSNGLIYYKGDPFTGALNHIPIKTGNFRKDKSPEIRSLSNRVFGGFFNPVIGVDPIISGFLNDWGYTMTEDSPITGISSFSEGKTHGTVTLTDTTGSIIYIGEFKDGVRIGEHRLKKSNGWNFRVRSYNEKGEYDGKQQNFERGVIEEEIVFSNGEKTEQKKWSYEVLRDKNEGDTLLLDRVKYIVSDTLRKWEIYYFDKENNDKLWLRVQFYNDSVIQVGYYTNGNIRNQFLYKPMSFEKEINSRFFDENKIRHGESVEYYENGQLFQKVTHIDGEQDGELLQYYENGQLKWKGMYKDDKQNGEFLNYYENGQLKYEGIVKEGKIVTEKNYDESGNLIK